ncbi:Tim44 domain-containing protein [Acetobacter papayae]|uniref:Tim44 domain-containing protein n=1 Tax=Acetobacter papayae TaxID=1076592 RepID=UPI0039E982B3
MSVRFFSSALAMVMTASLAIGPLASHADARAGSGGSMGSRGSRTWSAPPRTSTSPYESAPMERSITPRMAPTAPGYGAMGAAPFARQGMPYQNRHPFLTGFAGGFLGAGLFGLLSGHGFMGGVGGMFSFLGMLLQVGLVVMVVMWLVRRFSGGGGNAGRGMGAQGPARPVSPPFGVQQQANSSPVQITPADYQAFQQTLLDIQTAWNQQNIPAMQQMATPEMVSYFNEQLAALASQGARNVVSDVRFLQGDLAEAWSENGMNYATVAMRYSLIDLTTNAMGQVIDGSSTETVTITELWTFIRPARGGRWLLSAIQQTR